MNKITNFSIAAIMNSQSRSRCAEAVEDEEDELEAKRRKLAEAVPALGESKINVIHWESYIISIKELEKKSFFIGIHQIVIIFQSVALSFSFQFKVEMKKKPHYFYRYRLLNYWFF